MGNDMAAAHRRGDKLSTAPSLVFGRNFSGIKIY